MKLAIIQLSDIHFRTGNFEPTSDNSMAEQICAAVRTELIGSTHIILIINGDIAFSGLSHEYEYATEWLSNLYTLISDSCSGICWVLCAPGNHDVDHSSNNSVRNMIVDNIRNVPGTHIDSRIIDECVGEQSAFFSFRNSIESTETLVYDDPLLRVHRISDDQTNIQINILNSAWMSSLNETQGGIVYPIQLYNEQLKQSEGFAITVLHHPLSWFEPSNSRILRNRISEISSVCFCGHEHLPDSTSIATSSGDQVKFIDGGVLKNHDNSSDSSFNLVILNSDNHKIKDCTFAKKGDRYEQERGTSWQDATKLKSSESRRFRLTEKYRTEIEEIGINIIHPRRDEVYLRELFVYPDLLPISEKNSKVYEKLERTISSERLIFEPEISHVILEGDEKIGKTALLRKIFSDYYDRGKIPLYVLGSDIKSLTESDIRKSLQRIFEKTYEGDDFVQYEQLSPSDRVILLDDLEVSKQNRDGNERLLNFVRQFSSRSIVTTKDIGYLEQLVAGQPKSVMFNEHCTYSIREFGHLKRDELIGKWLRLGNQNEDWKSASILHERNHARDVINKTIGHNFMPSYPIFVMTILQSIESFSSSIVGSTYGHYYQFLITSALIRCGIKPDDLEAYSNYISELAYGFFENNRRISKTEYDNWHNQFCSNYGVDWKLSRIQQLLKEASILNVETGQSISFKYPYVYYFFLAKRLSRGLTEKNVCKNVEYMCQRLHVTEYANVILFLIHHSDNPLVLKAVRSAASSLISDQQSFEFETSDNNLLLRSVNQLPSYIGTHFLEDRDPENEQRRVLKNKDIHQENSIETENSTENQSESEHDPMVALDTLAQSIVATKTVELLGAILKNYYGSLLLNTKVSISKEAVELAFRSLFSFIELFLKDNGVALINVLVEARQEFEIENLQPTKRKNNQELENWARMFVFSILRYITKAVIQKVARAIGSDQLRLTLKKLVEEHDSIGYQIVEIAVLLDNPSKIPRIQIEKLAHRLSNNMFGFQVLRDLAAQRVYRYPIEYDDKQWLASKLDFSIDVQRRADFNKARQLPVS